MVDTWPEPYCIPSFDLMTGYCYPNCVTSQPGDIEECAETPDTSHSRVDCNGGIGNYYYGGVRSWGAVSSGQSVYGRCFTFAGGSGSPRRDADYYLFTLTERSYVSLRGKAEFPAFMGISDTALNHTIVTDYSLESCDSFFVQTVLDPGTYSANVSPFDNVGLPLEKHYRFTFETEPWESFPGSDCSDPVVQQGAGILINETTCLNYNDYDNTCLGDADEGEDRIYRFEPPGYGNWTIWLDPHGTPTTSIATDTTCPPDFLCHTSSTGNLIGTPHGLFINLDGPRYIVVDQYLDLIDNCIPTYDLFFQENCVSFYAEDVRECSELYWDSTHAFNDCNGGCYNEYAGGVARYGSVSSGDTLVGGLIQYWYDGFRNTDMDQFLFTITQPETVRVAAKCDVPFEIGIMDTNYCDYRSLVDWTQTLSYCDSLFITVPCLAPGTYAIYVTAAAGTIFAPASYRLSFQISSAPCPYMQGRDCANNIYMSGAYTLISQSTCPMQDDYDGTCLGSYDGGADIIYEWELQFAGDYYLWVDPHESIYTGLLLDDECPPSADNCIAIAYNSDAVPYGTDCMHLEAGTYYIMVDSWPYPYCIPQFDLSIGPCDSCITNQPGDTMECAESADSSNAANDCNGGCNNDDVGGINQFATISDGETVCGRAFTYIRNGLNYRDTDWYTFNLSQPETVHVTVATEFSAMVAIIDTIGNCNNVQLVATAFTEPCDTTIMHIDSLGAGQHFLWIGPYSYGGVPHERDYRLTFDAIPHSLGNDCATAMEIADEVTLTGLTTCGKLNDYDSTCLEGYDDGEDMVFAWTVTTGGMYTVWLNPRGSLASGVAIDDQCPPSYDNCLARSESWAEVEHGVCVTMDPGTYYIIVDTYPFVPCLPEFDLTITASEVPFNDLCENAIYLNVPGTTYGSTKCATVDVTPDCWEDPPYYPGVWYEITGTGTTITADVCNSGVQWNNRIGIYTCSCDSLVCVAAESDLCSDTSFLRPVSWCSRLGETYWILVHGLWGSTGDFRLDVYDDQIACPFGLRCPCADLTLTAPGQIADSTLGADNSCWSSSSPDKVVQVEIPSAGYWNFSLCGSDFDTYLLIGSDCCQFDVGSANDYFCNGEYGAQSVLCVYLPAAGYYYATIEGLGGAASEAGHFMLDVQPDDGFIPAQVTGVNATEDQCQVVVITWDDVVGEDGYAVWTDVGYWYVVPADCTQQIDFQINPGDGHWYTVYAIAACGEGPVSTADYGMAWRVVDAVQNLSATDTVCDSIYLTWNDVNDEDEYRIYRGGILVGSAGTDTTHFTDYPESGTYNYTVTAYNDICGEGPTSISDLGTRLPMPGFVANPTASSNFCDRIELSWTDAEHETAYYIDRDAVTLDTILPANTTSFTDCTAVPGITHEYSVISSNACGAQGVSALGARVPTPAQVSAVTASDTICDYVRITWDDAQGETGYRVARNGTTIATGIDADITTYHDADAVAGIVYEYVVCAYNIGCSGPWSVPDSGQRRTPPLSAPIPFIPDSCQAYHVCWTDVADAEGYRLYRNGILIDSVPSGILCFTDSTIPQPSQFSVAAYNACGEGPISPPILIGFPVLPSINSLTATDGLCDSIYLSWTVAGAADSCAVYRNAVPLGWTSAAVYTDRTAMPFTVCSYTIAGQNACGMGPLSAPNNGSMSDNPAQVLGVTATQNRCDSIIVTWTDVLHETHYRIIVDGMPVDSVPVNRTRFAHAPAAGTHQYTVQAVNQCGAGAASSTAEGIRLIAPGIPASIAASDNLCGSVTIWWGDATGDIDSYRFYRNGVFIGSALPAAESYVDSPVTGSFSYTVTAYSSECGEGGPSTPDSGTGHGVPSTPGNLQAITPVTCDSIRLTWNAAVGEVSQYIINRDGQPIDSTVQTHYTDHYLADNHEHDYMVKAYNPFCGFGPITDPVFGYVLTLMEVTTEMPDTVPSGQWLVLDVQYCSNTDSARMYLALNNGPYQYQRTFLPSARDSVFFEPVSNHTPNCHIMGLIYRDSRMDSLVLPSFVLAAANAADIQLSGIPADYFLARNYPNPFNPSTTIRFGVPVASEISIDIYDILGRHVASLLNTMVPPGVHTLIWDCSSCPSGMYVVRMQAGQRTFLNKMLLMK
ncbi:MAG: T9SS type A sorting domain-containing protein [Calditrichota bacterium]